jgi:D-glycero-D-manno-heptose 1,7-bisphosphate phosphatase
VSEYHGTPVLYLDLDGTVREGKDDPLGKFVNGPEDVRVFPAAVERMQEWRETGGRIIGITNQGGVALGYMTQEVCLAAVDETAKQTGHLFDFIMVCIHHPDASNPAMGRCWCRKPRAGLIFEGAADLAREYPGEFYPPALGLFVGDRPEDRKAARAANLDFMWALDWRQNGADGTRLGPEDEA